MVLKNRCLRQVLPLCLAVLAACVTGPSYRRVVGENGESQPAESISFEVQDYGELARQFVQELQQHALYNELRGDPASASTPAIAHKEFRVDMSDRNTKASIMEQKIRVELQHAGVRYINEQERQSMIESLRQQQSDLNDRETAAQFGKFANAKYYLVGRLYEVMHTITLNQKKREFHLVVDLLRLETLESRFVCDVVVTKYMEN
jgi:hypothetical protein